jgi:hypothetical protein
LASFANQPSYAGPLVPTRDYHGACRRPVHPPKRISAAQDVQQNPGVISSGSGNGLRLLGISISD